METINYFFSEKSLSHFFISDSVKKAEELERHLNSQSVAFKEMQVKTKNLESLFNAQTAKFDVLELKMSEMRSQRDDAISEVQRLLDEKTKFQRENDQHSLAEQNGSLSTNVMPSIVVPVAAPSENGQLPVSTRSDHDPHDFSLDPSPPNYGTLPRCYSRGGSRRHNYRRGTLTQNQHRIINILWKAGAQRGYRRQY